MRADLSAALARLGALDPADWPTGLSAANVRACWDGALADLDAVALTSPVAGTPPRAVLIVCSSNVFTAALPWMLHLRVRGIRTLVKPASGQERAIEAQAEAIGGVEVHAWQGGDVRAEAEALAGVDGVLAFGGAPALSAIRSRLPEGVVWLPFGPRYGIGVVHTLSAATVDDFALYDGHGCMSPAAVFARSHALHAAAGWMEAAEARWPRGAIDSADAAAIRARLMLARAAGRKIVGDGWAVIELGAAHFSPVALPRLLVVHPFTDVTEVRAAVAPWRAQLGTLSTDIGGLYLGAPRMCAPGRMQRPACGRYHDGIDVLGSLWRS